jgi:protocatechuate 3,4-dioxygenase beta subunit
MDSRGEPVRGATVEIWQVDNNGAYLHTRSDNRDRRDANFQGFGRFLTGSGGEYMFRTIKPVLYPGRTRHIHFAVKVPGQEKFITQCYVKGEPQNAKDNLLNSVKDPKLRELLIVDFAPLPGAKTPLLSARFNIVLGFTPAG